MAKTRKIEDRAQEFFGETLEIVTARNMIQYWWPEIQRYLHGRAKRLDKPATRSLLQLGLITKIGSHIPDTKIDRSIKFTPLAERLIMELNLKL